MTDDPDESGAPAEPTTTDGRRARRDRNREAVVAAVVEFLGEGNTQPTAQMVATRSGVSLRSVFRYFEDLDSLLTAAAVAFVERFEDRIVLPLPPPGTPLDERIRLLVDHRLALHPLSARPLAAAQLQAQIHPRLHACLELQRAAGADEVRQLFAPELEPLGDDVRATIVAAIHSVTTAEAWLNITDRHELGVDGQRDALTRLVRGALGVDGT